MLVTAVAGVIFCAASAAATVVPAPAWAPIAITGPTNLPPRQSEVQRVGVDAEGGSFTLSFNSQTTAPIPFDAAASEVQSRLNALSSIAPSSVTVSGGPGNRNSDHPYFVNFAGGALANTNVTQMSADNGALEGGGTSSVQVTTTIQGGSGTGRIAIYAQNVGGATSSGVIMVEDRLPPGLTVAGTATGEGWECLPSAVTVVCATTQSVAPGSVAKPITLPVRIGTASIELQTNKVMVSGGSAPTATYEEPVTISPAPARAGVQAFTAGFYQANGAPDTQAGSHPFIATFAVFVNTVMSISGKLQPTEAVKTIAIEPPPGVLSVPATMPGCIVGVRDQECPLEAQSGVIEPITSFGGSEADALHSVTAPVGYPAAFTFTPFGSSQLKLYAQLHSDADYGIVTELSMIPQTKPTFGAFFTLWGVPAARGHDELRCEVVTLRVHCGPSAADQTAFLTEPTDCALQAVQPPVVGLSFDTWQTAGVFEHRSVPLPPVSGCEDLGFGFGFALEPDGRASDSPAGFQARLSLPVEGLTEPETLAPAEAREAVVELPRGVAIDPAAADGLAACSEAEIGLENRIDPTTGLPEPEPLPNPLRFDETPNRCPEAAKLGSVEVKTALQANPLLGGLYMAKPDRGNPFGTPFAFYLVIEDTATGTVIKLPARVALDPRTGQVTISLADLPQLSIELLRLSFKGGSRALLESPTTCGRYSVEGTVTPWSAPESGPPLALEDTFTVDSEPGGSPCAETPAQRPFAMRAAAGTDIHQAAAASPFELQVTRPDGSQELTTLDLVLPPGVSADLRGIPHCPEDRPELAEGQAAAADKANPSCPAASQLGTVLTGAGAGSDPLYVSGKLYLAGPYKGAPLSLVSITPALAGPFDLGNLVIRAALEVDPQTAQITVRTDPLPRFLQGVGLRIRDLRLSLDRPGLIRNPTSCEPMSVRVAAVGDSGAVANLSNRFQVGGCDKLAFRPKLRLRLRGASGRNGHPALQATLSQAAGQANAASLSFAMPRSELLAQDHIRAVCSGAQFAAGACPPGSVYGHAEAFTPLTDQPLRGPVYLRSSPHKLPDLVMALRGPAAEPVAIDLVGRLDTPRGRIRVGFDSLPDAPISRLVLRMAGGRRGLLVNSTDLCAARPHATVRIIAHNNKRADRFPRLGAGC